MNYEFKVSHPTCFKCWNRFFLFFCSANTFLAYLYQFFCKGFFGFGKITKVDDNFIIKNISINKIPKVLNAYDYNSSFYKKNNFTDKENLFDIEKFTNYIWFLSD